jgi:hypothetical protein
LAAATLSAFSLSSSAMVGSLKWYLGALDNGESDIQASYSMLRLCLESQVVGTRFALVGI